MQKMINSRAAIGLALAIGRLVPPSVGYPLARFAARRIGSRRNSSMVRAARANQWVAGGESLSADELTRAVQDTFSHTAHCLYNLYHNLNDGAAMLKLVEFDSRAMRLIADARAAKQPAVIVGLHLSNFDFIMRAAAGQGLRVLGIAVAESGADSGYAWQNELRRSVGVEVMPASLSAVREAVQRLKQGETVVTGVDRPLPDAKHRLQFFGRPARLSVMHVHLALRAKVPIFVAAGIMRSDGKYHITVSDPITMRAYPDRKKEIVRNAEEVLSVAESFIRQAPRQWAMFHPVWPEVMDIMP